MMSDDSGVDVMSLSESNRDVGNDASALLDVIQVTPAHIRANGTLHDTPFEGLAELIDNAIDSGATTVSIENKTNDRGRYLTITDDGAGMDRAEALKTILIGHSMKSGDNSKIGNFGNGLKSGSMRIGDTMMMVTKKDDEYTVLLISLKYMDTVMDSKCYVPVVSYKLESDGYALEPTDCENELKQTTALSCIFNYSPFENVYRLQEFLREQLKGSSGTCIVIKDMRKLEDDKKFEMSYHQGDFVMPDRQRDGGSKYLSAFLQELYLDPKIIIYIQKKQVCLMDVRRSLAFPRWMALDNKGMDCFKKREQEKLDEEYRKITETRDVERAKLRKMQAKQHENPTDRQLSADVRRQSMALEQYDEQLCAIDTRRKDKNQQPGASIRVYMGIDVADRSETRAIFYSNGRRILTHDVSVNSPAAFKAIMGVCAVIDIPSTLLPTKQNREGFEIPSEFAMILKKVQQQMKTYFAHAHPKFKKPEFWASFGYDPDAPDAALANDLMDPTIDNVWKLIYDQTGRRKQCVKCHEFRTADFDAATMSDTLERTSYTCSTGCGPKTPQELKDEEIQKLNEKVAPTYYTVVAPEKKGDKVVKKPNMQQKKYSYSSSHNQKKRKRDRSSSSDDEVIDVTSARSSHVPLPAKRKSIPSRSRLPSSSSSVASQQSRPHRASKPNRRAFIDSDAEQQEREANQPRSSFSSPLRNCRKRTSQASLDEDYVPGGDDGAPLPVKQEPQPPPLFTLYPSKARIRREEMMEHMDENAGLDDDYDARSLVMSSHGTSMSYTGIESRSADGWGERSAAAVPRPSARAAVSDKTTELNGMAKEEKKNVAPLPKNRGVLKNETPKEEKNVVPIGQNRGVLNEMAKEEKTDNSSSHEAVYDGSGRGDEPEMEVEMVVEEINPIDAEILAIYAGEHDSGITHDEDTFDNLDYDAELNVSCGAVMGGPAVSHFASEDERRANFEKLSDEEKTRSMLGMQTRLFEAKQELADAQETIEKKDEQIASLEKKLTAAVCREAAAFKANREKDEEIVAFKQLFKEDAISKASDDEKKTAEIAELKKQLADATAAAEEAAVVIQQQLGGAASSSSAPAASAPSTTSDEVWEKEQEIMTLNQEVEKTNAELQATTDRFAQTKAALEAKEKQLTISERRLAKAKQTNETRDREMSHITTMFAECEKQRREAEAALEAMRAKSIEESSTSLRNDHSLDGTGHHEEIGGDGTFGDEPSTSQLRPLNEEYHQDDRAALSTSLICLED